MKARLQLPNREGGMSTFQELKNALGIAKRMRKDHSSLADRNEVLKFAEHHYLVNNFDLENSEDYLIWAVLKYERKSLRSAMSRLSHWDGVLSHRPNH
jgi:hypothetical protein